MNETACACWRVATTETARLSNFMAALEQKRIIVQLTPEDLNRRLAESILVTRGIDFTGKAHVLVAYNFAPDKKTIRSARVEITR